MFCALVMAVMQIQEVKSLRLFHCWNGWLCCCFSKTPSNPGNGWFLGHFLPRKKKTITWAGSAGESCDWQGPKGLPRHFAGHDCWLTLHTLCHIFSAFWGWDFMTRAEEVAKQVLRYFSTAHLHSPSLPIFDDVSHWSMKFRIAQSLETVKRNFLIG